MTVMPPATAHHVVSRLMRESLVDKKRARSVPRPRSGGSFPI